MMLPAKPVAAGAQYAQPEAAGAQHGASGAQPAQPEAAGAQPGASGADNMAQVFEIVKQLQNKVIELQAALGASNNEQGEMQGKLAEMKEELQQCMSTEAVTQVAYRQIEKRLEDMQYYTKNLEEKNAEINQAKDAHIKTLIQNNELQAGIIALMKQLLEERRGNQP
jgi:predicted RNase H-like nuclease (RuvC/YqgF family)